MSLPWSIHLRHYDLLLRSMCDDNTSNPLPTFHGCILGRSLASAYFVRIIACILEFSGACVLAFEHWKGPGRHIRWDEKWCSGNLSESGSVLTTFTWRELIGHNTMENESLQCQFGPRLVVAREDSNDGRKLAQTIQLLRGWYLWKHSDHHWKRR